MPPMRDIRLYDFYPLVHRLSFGQSVKETDLIPVPSDAPGPRSLCFQLRHYSMLKSTSVPGLLRSRFFGRASSFVRTLEMVGERHV